MCVCVCVYIYIYICVYIYVYIYTRKYENNKGHEFFDFLIFGDKSVFVKFLR